MAQQTINIGSSANDGTGDTLRAGGDKINDNFTELYGAIRAPVATESGTTYDLASADEGKYIRFTNTSAKTVNVRDEVDHALPANGEWHIRNVGANDLTLDEDTAVTINPPADGTLVVPPGGTVTLKRVAEDEFDLFGVTVPA